MTPRSALLLLALAASSGCTRYNTRGQAPQSRTPPPPGIVPPKSNLAMPAPTTPPPPRTTEEAGLVPPRPPGGPAVGVLPPQPPSPPPVPPRSGPPAMPSPYAQQPPAALTPAAPTTPVSATTPAAGDDVRRVLTTAAAKWEAVPSYDAVLTRREFVKDKPPTAETVEVQFRKEPFAIFMHTTSDNGKGRQVLYVKGQYDDKLHIKTGKGDPGAFLISNLSMSPDDPQVTSRSRYSVREAGFGNAIVRLAAFQQKYPGSVKYAGRTQRPEFSTPVERIDQTLAPGAEVRTPGGGTRYWFFDAEPSSPSYGLPVLVIATDPNGKELEYYCHTAVRVPSSAAPADFTPERVTRKK